MIYEKKKAILMLSIINAYKQTVGNSNHIIYTDQLPTSNVSETDIGNILKQFELEGKLKILKMSFNTPLKVKGYEFIDEHLYHKAEINDVDIKFFEDEYIKYSKYLEEDSFTKVDTFFITYTSDRRILLNGKIEIAKPDFESENERVFTYLYQNKNKALKIRDIKQFYKEEYDEELTKSFDKILENLGFVRGLRSTFFDLTKTTIRFKNPVKL